MSTFLQYTNKGSSFVFGYLVSKQPFHLASLDNSTLAYEVAETINEKGAMKFILMFEVFSAIYFFSFMVSMLFYLGAIQWVVVKMGWILQVSILVLCLFIMLSLDTFLSCMHSNFRLQLAPLLVNLCQQLQIYFWEMLKHHF